MDDKNKDIKWGPWKTTDIHNISVRHSLQKVGVWVWDNNAPLYVQGTLAEFSQIESKWRTFTRIVGAEHTDSYVEAGSDPELPWKTAIGRMFAFSQGELVHQAIKVVNAAYEGKQKELLEVGMCVNSLHAYNRIR